MIVGLTPVGGAPSIVRVGSMGPSHGTFHTIQYNTIQCNTIPYDTIRYHTIPYNTIQYLRHLPAAPRR